MILCLCPPPPAREAASLPILPRLLPVRPQLPPTQAPESWPSVQRLAVRWQAHLSTGRWRYTDHAFWVTPAPFCWMRELAPELHEELAGSCLLVFKVGLRVGG